MEHDPAPFDAPSPLVPSARAPALVVAGVAMLAVPFVLSNPSFGLDHRAWPWEPAARGSLRGDVLTLLWALTGAWCVALGLTRAVALRAIGGAALAVILLIELTRGIPPFAAGWASLAAILPKDLYAKTDKIFVQHGGSLKMLDRVKVWGVWMQLSCVCRRPNAAPCDEEPACISGASLGIRGRNGSCEQCSHELCNVKTGSADSIFLSVFSASAQYSGPAPPPHVGPIQPTHEHPNSQPSGHFRPRLRHGLMPKRPPHERRLSQPASLRHPARRT